MANTDAERLPVLLGKLDVPSEFSQYDGVSETNVIVRLETWRRQVYTVLSELCVQLGQRELAIEEKAQVVSAVAPFDGEGPWILETAREQARGMSLRLQTLYI